MQRLFDYATQLGVKVEYTDLRHLRRCGDFSLHEQLIRLQPGMLPKKERSILAHELGHATFKHEPCMFEHLNQRQERAADEWAAHFLINAGEYRLAVERFGTQTKWIAQELGVLEKLVHAYEHSLERIGDTVYVKPRMGLGQWNKRYQIA